MFQILKKILVFIFINDENFQTVIFVIRKESLKFEDGSFDEFFWDMQNTSSISKQIKFFLEFPPTRIFKMYFFHLSPKQTYP